MNWGPKSLAGQLAVLLGIALLIAQTINVALLLQSRGQLAAARDEATFSRVISAIERIEAIDLSSRRPLQRLRGPRAIFFSEAALAENYEVRGESSARLRERLAEIDVVAETAVLAHIGPEEYVALRASFDVGRPRNDGRTRLASGESVLISVEIETGKWINIAQPLPVDPPLSIAQILAQTAIIYVVLLAGVLFIARRLSGPLERLTTASQTFLKSSDTEPLVLEGPEDVRQLTDAFNVMRDRVYRLFSEKDVMLGAIGHDLRTPLTSLRIRVESVTDDKLRSAMIETLDEMSMQLEDILSLARSGDSPVPPEMISLAAFARDALEALNSPPGDATLGFVADGDAVIHAPWMRRIVRNLLENALRYGDKAELSIDRQDGFVRFIVDDEGPGIPETELADMTKPFVRGEASRNRQTGGSGLGLSIVAGLASRQGGQLDLQNRNGGGLRAVVSVPDQRAPENNS